MSSTDLPSLHAAVADFGIAHPDDRDWWERGAFLTAVLRGGSERQRKAVEAWLRRAVARQTSAGILANDERDELTTGHLRVATPTPANATAFAFPLLLLHRDTREPALLDAALLHARALLATPRTADGGIPLRTEAPELWVDMAHIMAPFLALLGAVTGEDRYTDECFVQIAAIEKRLVDPHAGLARHVWCEKPNHYPQSTFWARGNGWLVAGLADILEILPDDPRRSKLSDLLVRIMSSMAALQDRNGYLRHVLDDPHARFESSGTLMFAYAALKGTRLGLFDDSFASAGRRALDIVSGSVRPDGGVPGVAVPPGGPGVPFGTSPIGQGFFLLAAQEAMRGDRAETVSS